MVRTTANDRSFLSVITIGEIERGIARQRTTDPGFATALADGWTGSYPFMAKDPPST